MKDIFDPFREENIDPPIKEGYEGRCGICGEGGGMQYSEIFENRRELEEFLEKVTTYDLTNNGPTYIKWKEEHKK